MSTMKNAVLTNLRYLVKGLLASGCVAAAVVYVLEGAVPFGSDASTQIFWSIVKLGSFVTTVAVAANTVYDLQRWKKNRREHRRIARKLGIKL